MITIAYATETGNAECLAIEAGKKLKKFGFENECLNIAEVTIRKLCEEVDTLLAIVSTWGDGEPPVDAEDFYFDLKKAESPILSNLEFSVLALGDSTYDDFCQFGKDLEAELERHTSKKITDRIDCDVDYEKDFDAWMTGVLRYFITRRNP